VVLQVTGVPSLVTAVAPTSEQRQPSRAGGPPGFGAVDGGVIVVSGGGTVVDGLRGTVVDGLRGTVGDGLGTVVVDTGGAMVTAGASGAPSAVVAVTVVVEWGGALLGGAGSTMGPVSPSMPSSVWAITPTTPMAATSSATSTLTSTHAGRRRSPSMPSS
jgi:hypothetical protein